MSSFEHRFCLAQPSVRFSVGANARALALTFPRLVHDLRLREGEFVFYESQISVDGFEEYLEREGVSHVLLTAITATFPDAVRLAGKARAAGCVTVLGGIFSTLNAEIIAREFGCFDYVVVGKPDHQIRARIAERQDWPRVLVFPRQYEMTAPIGNVIDQAPFRSAYSESPVSYELTSGCRFACNFCSLRAAWGQVVSSARAADAVERDLTQLARGWKRLKLIDDDCLQNLGVLGQVEAGRQFEEVIVETRVDQITPRSAETLRAFGATHVILGVESFDPGFLAYCGKTHAPEEWASKVDDAIALIVSNGLVARPVVMLTAPFLGAGLLRDLRARISSWRPENRVETFFSFFTPHPGAWRISDKRRVITTDLAAYDHLHLVYVPDGLERSEIPVVLEGYQELVELTASLPWNPPMEPYLTENHAFDCFFQA